MTDKPGITYTISQIAEALDISTRTIRFYEEKGMISPQRTPGNQRIYTPRNKARLRLILRGKRFGFTLDEIAEMIGLADNHMDEGEQIRKALAFGDAKLREIEDRKKDLLMLEQDLLATREKMLRRLKELDSQTWDKP